MIKSIIVGIAVVSVVMASSGLVLAATGLGMASGALVYSVEVV